MLLDNMIIKVQFKFKLAENEMKISDGFNFSDA